MNCKDHGHPMEPYCPVCRDKGAGEMSDECDERREEGALEALGAMSEERADALREALHHVYEDIRFLPLNAMRTLGIITELQRHALSVLQGYEQLAQQPGDRQETCQGFSREEQDKINIACHRGGHPQKTYGPEGGCCDCGARWFPTPPTPAPDFAAMARRVVAAMAAECIFLAWPASDPSGGPSGVEAMPDDKASEELEDWLRAEWAGGRPRTYEPSNICPQCGIGVALDEDGSCANCGATSVSSEVLAQIRTSWAGGQGSACCSLCNGSGSSSGDPSDDFGPGCARCKGSGHEPPGCVVCGAPRSVGETCARGMCQRAKLHRAPQPAGAGEVERGDYRYDPSSEPRDYEELHTNWRRLTKEHNELRTLAGRLVEALDKEREMLSDITFNGGMGPYEKATEIALHELRAALDTGEGK